MKETIDQNEPVTRYFEIIDHSELQQNLLKLSRVVHKRSDRDVRVVRELMFHDSCFS